MANTTPKRLDPKQHFVALGATREEIAETLNGIMENEGWKGEKFTKDDPRLTDEVCQDVVDGTQSAFCDVDDTQDIEYQYNKESLAGLLDIDTDEEDDDDA